MISERHNRIDGIPKVEWYPEHIVHPRIFIDLCEKAGFCPLVARIGRLKAPWRNHLTGATIVGDIVEFVIIDDKEND
jgi:hypothetical protein